MSNEKEMKKIYITKYALTGGIFSIVCKINNSGYALEKNERGYPVNAYSPSAYADTMEQAIEKAEKMRDKKIKNLKKQIEKLENLTFGK
jgi:hypothetical protein